MKILVAGVGNVLRGDDGFGVAVAQTIAENDFSDDIDIFEAGIAGIAFVQELMNGYDALIIADAVERNAAPGTIFVFKPEISDSDDPTSAEFHRTLADAHYTEPSKVFVLARALEVMPPKVFVVGCQHEGYDELGAELSPAVTRAVPIAIERIKSLVKELQQSTEPQDAQQAI